MACSVLCGVWYACSAFYLLKNILPIFFACSSGPFPSYFARELLNLSNIEISNNFITSTIPPDLMRVLANSTTYLDFGSNLLTGTIPYEMGHMVHLIELDLSANALSGPVPTSFSSLKDLNVLALQYNCFTGNLDNLVNATHQRHVASIDIGHNQFTGTV